MQDGSQTHEQDPYPLSSTKQQVNLHVLCTCTKPQFEVTFEVIFIFSSMQIMHVTTAHVNLTHMSALFYLG